MTTVEQLSVETWVEYGFITLILLTRMGVRIRVLGLRRLQWDDALMPIAWMFQTAMSIAAYIVAQKGDNANLGTDAERLQIVTETPQLAETYATGSKLFVVGWYTYTGFLWTLKLCMLFLFQRITEGLWMSRLIKPLMCLVGVFWVAILILISSLCRPFHKYWQVYPDPGANCTPETSVFYITVLAMNLTTDAFIVCIPLPMLLQARMSHLRRLALILLLCAGAFVMIAAILRVYFVFTNADAATPAIWACRETLVAMYVANMPLILPMFQPKFWQGNYRGTSRSGKSDSSRGRRGHHHHVELGYQSLEHTQKPRKRFRHPNDMDTFLAKDGTLVDRTRVDDVDSASTERIYEPEVV